LIDSKRILVVAPHPDDEVIGCGGTIALCAERGAEVHLLVVFDGAAGDPEHKFEAHSYVAKRQAEARAAGEQLGVSQYTFWDLPEGHLATEAEVEQGAERLRSFVNEVQPDLILAPWWGDNHEA
jgi:LmbE family N-acetylglucosaminyl deacetylase